MKALHLLAALLAFAAAPAVAGNPWPNGVPTGPARPPAGSFGHHGFHRGFGNGFILYGSPEVYYEREIIREVPVVVAPPPPPPPPRKPYALGKLYESLPGGCMKMVEGGASFFQCSGEWYRQVPGGYRAVRQP